MGFNNPLSSVIAAVTGNVGILGKPTVSVPDGVGVSGTVTSQRVGSGYGSTKTGANGLAAGQFLDTPIAPTAGAVALGVMHNVQGSIQVIGASGSVYGVIPDTIPQVGASVGGAYSIIPIDLSQDINYIVRFISPPTTATPANTTVVTISQRNDETGVQISGSPATLGGSPIGTVPGGSINAVASPRLTALGSVNITGLYDGSRILGIELSLAATGTVAGIIEGRVNFADGSTLAHVFCIIGDSANVYVDMPGAVLIDTYGSGARGVATFLVQQAAGATAPTQVSGRATIYYA